MTIRWRVCAAAAWFGGLAGCGGPEHFALDLSGLKVDYGILVAFDEDDRPQATHPFRLDESGVALEWGLDRFEFEGERVWLAAFDADVLKNTEVRFDEARASELELAFGPVALPPTGFREEALPLEGHARLFRIELDRVAKPIENEPPAILRAASLVVPTNLSHCEPQNLRFEAFGAERLLLPEVGPVPPGTNRTFVRMTRLGPDHFIAATLYSLFIVERGQPIDLSRGLYSRSFNGEEPVVFRGIAVSPELRPDGRRTLLAVGNDVDHTRGGIWEFSVDSSSITFEREIPLLPSPLFNQAPPVGSVLYDARGAAVVTGFEGLAAYMRPGEAGFTAVQVPRRDTGLDEDNKLRELIVVPDAEYPHVFASDKGAIFQGDIVESRWLPALQNFSPSYHALAVSPDGTEIWGGGRNGPVYRKKSGGGWDLVDIRIPDGPFDACSEISDAGIRERTGMVGSIALDDQFAYLLIEGCTGLLVLSRDDDCTFALARDVEGVRAAEGDGNLELLRSGEDFLLFGEQGGVFRLAR